MRVIGYEEIDSTNLEAKRLIDLNAINGTTIISAKKQTQGRGRLERSWQSFQGNLMFSIVFPNAWVKNNLLPACTCIAVQNAIMPNDTVYFKWPNDIIINDGGTPKKCCGILIETHHDWCIVGIGVNVLHHPNLTLYQATNLHEHGLKIQTEETIAQNLFSLLRKNLQEILTLWSARNFFAEKEVTIGETKGIFKSVDNEFNAILDVNGIGIKVPFGDLKNQ